MRSVWQEHSGHTLHTGDSSIWRFPNKGKPERETSAGVWILGIYFKVSVSPGFHQYKYQYCKKNKASRPCARGRTSAQSVIEESIGANVFFCCEIVPKGRCNIIATKLVWMDNFYFGLWPGDVNVNHLPVVRAKKTISHRL